MRLYCCQEPQILRLPTELLHLVVYEHLLPSFYVRMGNQLRFFGFQSFFSINVQAFQQPQVYVEPMPHDHSSVPSVDKTASSSSLRCIQRSDSNVLRSCARSRVAATGCRSTWSSMALDVQPCTPPWIHQLHFPTVTDTSILVQAACCIHD